MRFTLTLSLLLSLFLLNGCVSLRLDNAATAASSHYLSPTARAQQLSRIKNWTIQGALSLRMNNKTSLANYRWTQENRSLYHIHLSSSLNLYVLDIQGQPGLVSINDHKNKPRTGQSPAALIQQLIGYPLPVNNLYYWIRGLSAPGKLQVQYDQYGRISSLKQQNWVLHFLRYTQVKSVDLPQMIDITSPTLKIRIVIKQWST